jgi:hypothetical protein
MKRFLCIDKLLSSFFHPIPIDPAHSTILQTALLTRFEQGGQQNDLNEAISLHIASSQSPKLPPIPINLAHSTISQMHCQADLRKEVSKMISMKPFLCIDKLLSSSFHPILILSRPCTLRTRFQRSEVRMILTKPFLCTDKFSSSSLHPIPVELARSIISVIHY